MTDLIEVVGSAEANTLLWVMFFVIAGFIARILHMIGAERSAEDVHRNKLTEMLGKQQAQLVGAMNSNSAVLQQFLGEQEKNREVQRQFIQESALARDQRREFFSQLAKDMAAQTGAIGDNTLVVEATKEAIEMSTSQLTEVRSALVGINTSLNTVITSLNAMRGNVDQVNRLTEEVKELRVRLDEIIELIKTDLEDKPASEKGADVKAVEKGVQSGRAIDISDSRDSRGD